MTPFLRWTATLIGPRRPSEASRHRPISPRRFSLERLEERQLLAVFVVGSAADEIAGITTLRSAILDANFLGGQHTIELSADTYLLTRRGDEDEPALDGDLDITANIEIIGQGATASIIDAHNFDRVFDVWAGGQLTLTSLTVRNGTPINEDGGGIRNAGTLRLVDATIEANHAHRLGGGIYAAAGATTTIEDSRLFFNHGDERGGALYAEANTTTTITNTSITHNVGGFGGFDGAGAVATLGTLTLTGSTVAYNRGHGDGGAFQVLEGGSLTIRDSMFLDNIGDSAGGAIEIEGGTALIEDSIFDSNIAVGALGDGGAIAVTKSINDVRGNLTLIRSQIINNVSESRGGGLYILHSDALIIDSTIAGNTSDEAAGGLEGSHGSSVTIERSTISGNRTEGSIISSGGGISFSGDELTVTNSTISGNRTSAHGGGIYIVTVTPGGFVVLANNTIVDNVAGRIGGGITAFKPIEILNNVVANNVDAGGGLTGPDIYVFERIVSHGHMARPIKNVPLGLTRNGLEMINLSHERRNASYHGFSSARG
jgi:hypothetical protein